MQIKEWTQINHNTQLDVGLLHAWFVQHAYPRHSHEYYVISLIAQGRQSFTHKGTKYTTPPGGVILIHSEAVHTGEADDELRFDLRSIFPTISHMKMAMFEWPGRSQNLPIFSQVRVDDPRVAGNVLALHKAILGEADVMESEALFIHTLAQLIKRYADTPSIEQRLGHERQAIQKARRYIDDHFA